MTGGGKTAIYVEAIAAALAEGRPALVLVPEIALALPLVDRLRADLDARIALVHSGLGDGERADEWRRIRAGDVDIVVGTRLAVVAPLADVGVVIVDEEHDPGVQERPNAAAPGAGRGDPPRGARRRRGRPRLGDAGGRQPRPRARRATYDRIVLPTTPDRTSRRRSTVVDLRAELAEGNRGLLSRTLDEALAALDTAAGEQAILVLNRRGTASVVLCRDCGHVQACPDCERPLVYHQAGTTLRCHHCGRATPLATRCPTCGRRGSAISAVARSGSSARFARRIPRSRVARLDRDVAERRGAAETGARRLRGGQTDVLVGTSLVAKGLDVPAVTLVGVVSSDVALNLPDERAAERTYQLLCQAVGRAGRGERPGRAILQTYQPDHPVIRAVAGGDGEAFYAEELALRRRFGSPPFGSAREAHGRAPGSGGGRARGRGDGRHGCASAPPSYGTTVIGPAPAYIARRNDRWRYHLILRGEDPRRRARRRPGTAVVGRRGPGVAALSRTGSVDVAAVGDEHAADLPLEPLQVLELARLELDRMHAVARPCPGRPCPSGSARRP